MQEAESGLANNYKPLVPHIDDEDRWKKWRRLWTLRNDTIYLNHGSFGPPPVAVQESRELWSRRLSANPMDFFVRNLEDELLDVRNTLAKFVGATPENMLLLDNATYGMNVVADSFPLNSGDQILLTDHIYGAVRRIWQRRCNAVGATLVTVQLPCRIESAEQVVEALVQAMTQNTKLLVVSHITSATAITLPVAAIVAAARERGIVICVDGPHAVAQLPLRIDELGADFYAASCHKWLSAGFGSGFLYVHPRWREHIQPPILSWGKTDQDDATPSPWDELWWPGTRDPTSLLTIPAAIGFLKQVGLDRFRARCHYLARYARARLSVFTDGEPLTPDDPQWYGAMAHVPLPDGEARPLQRALFGQYGIEVPVIEFGDRRWIRVSCHLYTQPSDIDKLVGALQTML